VCPRGERTAWSRWQAAHLHRQVAALVPEVAQEQDARPTLLGFLVDALRGGEWRAAGVASRRFAAVAETRRVI
jgi:hypothetical protein